MSDSRSEQGTRHVVTPRLDLDIELFLSDCRVRRLAAGTLKVYRRNLQYLRQWATEHPIPEITPQDLRLFFLSLQEIHNAGGQHQVYRTCRAFFRWLMAEGLVSENPMARLRPPQVREEPLTPVPLSHVAAMLADCESRLSSGGHRILDLRDAALLLALLDTAARASELLACSWGDFDPMASALVLRVTKNRKQRITFLGQHAKRALLRYMRARGQPPVTAPLFVAQAGRRLTYWGLRMMLKRRAERAGVPVPAVHSFRRAACLAMLRDGADLLSVQQIAGHADLSTTRRYLRLVVDDLQRVHAAHSPGDKLLK